MHANALLAALRRMGYQTGDITAHGFRATFSTTLNELGHNPDVIERALAHVPKDKIRAAYHRSKYLEERRVLLQTWADMIDGKCVGANVVPIRRKVGPDSLDRCGRAWNARGKCETHHHRFDAADTIRWLYRLWVQLGMNVPDIISLNAFWVNKWGNPVCEVCRTQNWNWSANEAFPYMGVPAISPQDVMSGPFWGVMGLTCSNCGNLKLINLQIVWDWLSSEEGKKKLELFKKNLVSSDLAGGMTANE